MYLFSAAQSTLWDRDESRFCRATVEMIDSGNYLYPTFGGQLRPDKPILIYWLMSVPMRVLGATALACRFWSAVGVSAACLLTWFCGARLFGHRAGVWAMLVLAASPLVLWMGKFATADGALLPMLTGAVACFVASLAAGRARPHHIVLMALALGLAMLTKGPLGLVPLLVIFVALWLGRGGTMPLGRGCAGWALLATLGGLAMFVAWGLWANAATDGEFLRQGLGRHVLERMVRPQEGHGGGTLGKYLAYLPFYVPVLIGGFFPWIIYLPGGVSAALGGRLGGRTGRAVLIAMTLPVVVLMTLVSTKLPHYVMPAWPGLALGVGATLEAAASGRLTDRDRRWLRRGDWALGIMGGAAGLGALIGAWFVPLPSARPGMMLFGAVLTATTVWAIWYNRRRSPRSGAKRLLGGMLALELVIALAIMPALEEVKPSPELAAAVRETTPPEAPVATYGFDEPSFTFYLGRNVRSFWHEQVPPEEVVAWLREPAEGVLVVRGKHLPTLEAAAGAPIGNPVVARYEGLNLGKGRWEELLVLRRGPQ